MRRDTVGRRIAEVSSWGGGQCELFITVVYAGGSKVSVATVSKAQVVLKWVQGSRASLGFRVRDALVGLGAKSPIAGGSGLGPRPHRLSRSKALEVHSQPAQNPQQRYPSHVLNLRSPSASIHDGSPCKEALCAGDSGRGCSSPHIEELLGQPTVFAGRRPCQRQYRKQQQQHLAAIQ